MTLEKQTVHSGNTINIRIGAKIVGRIQGMDGERSFGTEGLYEIGSIMPQEFVNLRFQGSLSMERFFVRNSDLAKAGYGSLGEEVLKMSVFTIEVVDKYTHKVVRSYHGCKLATHRETFRANSIAGENATWLYQYAK